MRSSPSCMAGYGFKWGGGGCQPGVFSCNTKMEGISLDRNYEYKMSSVKTKCNPLTSNSWPIRSVSWGPWRPGVDCWILYSPLSIRGPVDRFPWPWQTGGSVVGGRWCRLWSLISSPPLVFSSGTFIQLGRPGSDVTPPISSILGWETNTNKQGQSRFNPVHPHPTPVPTNWSCYRWWG